MTYDPFIVHYYHRDSGRTAGVVNAEFDTPEAAEVEAAAQASASLTSDLRPIIEQRPLPILAEDARAEFGGLYPSITEGLS